MSHISHLSESNSFQERVGAGGGRDRPSTGEESEGPLSGTIAELFDVLVATDALLETIDLESLPEVVDVGELRTLVDLERLSAAIRERDPDLVFDLSHLERVVDRRELWNSIDVLEFVNAERTLDRELEDVLGEDAATGIGTDSKAAADAEAFVSSLRADGRDVLVQQQARERMEVLREGVIEAHAAIERVYASNRRRSGTATGRPGTRRSTAVSLHPSGPLPDSASTRLSTVPPDLPYSKIDALPRIYGGRWRRVGPARSAKRS